MSTLKTPLSIDVQEAARRRIAYAFDNFERLYVSFSAGKDSTVMLHMAMAEARRRKRKIGILLIDLEAQYKLTIQHAERMVKLYADCAEPYWICLPIKLRNSVSNYEPVWCAWEPGREESWIRQKPDIAIKDATELTFFQDRMEFEEFIVLFADWYAQGKSCAALIGIRCDESLNRFRTIADANKEMHRGHRFTTRVIGDAYNVYPLYDWRTEDLWRYHANNPSLPYNEVYDRMHLAGVPLSQMRLCQPYGDDQKRGLWLYHLIEPETWGKLIARVNGANSGALYIEETGNITGRMRISRPPGHTWKSFASLLLSTMPPVTREHYVTRLRSWLKGWKTRGYAEIPDEAPALLEKKYWAPSWRRVCKVLLRNDWWCKGLGLTQPKSAAYERYMKMRKDRRCEFTSVNAKAVGVESSAAQSSAPVTSA